MSTEDQPTVWAVQQPFRDVDLSPALEYGRVEWLLEQDTGHGPRGRQLAYETGSAQREMEIKLQSFDPERDFLLLIGDPAATGLATAIVTKKYGGKFTMLKWDRKAETYYPVFVNLSKGAA